MNSIDQLRQIIQMLEARGESAEKALDQALKENVRLKQQLKNMEERRCSTCCSYGHPWCWAGGTNHKPDPGGEWCGYTEADPSDLPEMPPNEHVCSPSCAHDEEPQSLTDWCVERDEAKQALHNKHRDAEEPVVSCDSMGFCSLQTENCPDPWCSVRVPKKEKDPSVFADDCVGDPNTHPKDW